MNRDERARPSSMDPSGQRIKAIAFKKSIVTTLVVLMGVSSAFLFFSKYQRKREKTTLNV